MKKVCAKCKESKDLKLFHRNKNNKDGRFSYCNKCNNKRRIIYTRSKKGLIAEIYNTQKEHSRRRNHPAPSYSVKELSRWMIRQKAFLGLYNGLAMC